jgi:hypothetical protein
MNRGTEGPLSLGWASRDITPTRPVAVRGQFNLRIATHAKDPLTLTALAVEGGGEGVILASLDSCSADPEVVDRARDALATRLPGLDPTGLIASGTHTHTAPFAGGAGGLQDDADYMADLLDRYPDYMSIAEYTDLAVEALVSAACEAWEKRRPGSVSWGYSYAVVGENRRVRYFDDRAVMYGKTSDPDFSHIEGHVDHGVNLLFTYDAAKRPTGLVVNVACPSQASEGGQDYLSADYWHEVRQEVRGRYGAGLFILPQCSAAGDQSPHRLIAARAEERMLRLKHGDGLDRSRNQGLRRDIARRIADAVGDAEPAVRAEARDRVVLKREHRKLDLPHWDVTEAEYAALQTEMAQLRAQLESVGEGDRLSGEYTSLSCRLAWCQRAADRYTRPLESVAAEMSILRLGDVAFVTAPFEYYLDFGDRIKGRSPALQTFIVQLASGGCYLPTERAAAGLSYGAVPASCRVAPRGGQMMVDEAVATMEAMFATE